MSKIALKSTTINQIIRYKNEIEFDKFEKMTNVGVERILNKFHSNENEITLEYKPIIMNMSSIISSGCNRSEKNEMKKITK